MRSCLCLVLVLLLGCGDDVAPGTDGGTECSRSADCDDGLFCNGSESCDPDDPGSNAEGCVPGEVPPCVERCDEVGDECVGGCSDGDADRDGADSIACGGNDCDDADPNRFPGNTEVCDSEGNDEDCDPTTLGFDLDGDGFVGDRCCNDADGELTCGMDCDDLSRGSFPGATDSCNGTDDDCDGAVDEEATLTFYFDGDGDGFGLADDPELADALRPIQACERPDGYALVPGDCNDDNPFAQPGGTERCAPLGDDEDCDGEIDEFGDGAASPAVDLVTYYRDDDFDGWGKVDDVRVSCAPPALGNWSLFPGDCRDDLAVVNPDASYAREPACPADRMVEDTVEFVMAAYCGGSWACVTESGGCSSPLTEPRFLPVWDLDCDGEVRAQDGACIDGSAAACDVLFLTGSPIDPDQCGQGTGYYANSTDCFWNGSACIPNGDGPGTAACR